MESMSSIINLITDALEEHDLKPSSIGSTVDDKGRPVLVLDGLVYDPASGTVRTDEREYRLTYEFTVTVEMTRTAANEEDARDRAEEDLGWVSFECDIDEAGIPSVDGWEFVSVEENE